MSCDLKAFMISWISPCLFARCEPFVCKYYISKLFFFWAVLLTKDRTLDRSSSFDETRYSFPSLGKSNHIVIFAVEPSLPDLFGFQISISSAFCRAHEQCESSFRCFTTFPYFCDLSCQSDSRSDRFLTFQSPFHWSISREHPNGIRSGTWITIDCMWLSVCKWHTFNSTFLWGRFEWFLNNKLSRQICHTTNHYSTIIW
jgi:hypothetical protein